MKISIIGSGRVAWHLAPALEDAGHSVLEVYSRQLPNAKKLASKLYNAEAIDHLDLSDSRSELIILAVPDDVIEIIASDLIVPDKAIVVHTSGSKPLNSLDLYFERKGVFYPLQTFSKSRKIHFEGIPICLESDDQDVLKKLTSVAKSISPEIHYLETEKRKVLHVAAVFACNFTNHLLALSKEILDSEDIDYGILDALISETINKALENDPHEVQTGPAIRKDVKIVKEHLQYLSEDPAKKEIYRLLSESILKSNQ